MTLAMRVMQAPQRRGAAFALRAWPALPALALIRPAALGSPLLPDYAGQVLGIDATLCLLACLAVTPVMTTVRLRIAALRYWYGIWVFVLGAAGLAIAVSMPGADSLTGRAAGSAVSWSGTLIVVLLLPMAATSHRVAQKLLGPEWKKWQRQLIWTVWVVTLGHLLLLHAFVTAAALVGATAPLILLRWPRVRRAVKAWRASGYDSGGLWAVLAACCVLVAAGVVVLLVREGQAIARAVTLAV